MNCAREDIRFGFIVLVMVSAGEVVRGQLQRVVYPLMHWLMEDYILVAQSARQALQAVAFACQLR